MVDSGWANGKEVAVSQGIAIKMEMKMKKQRVPKIAETLNYFDDGKLIPSRVHSVTVIDVIPFAEAPYCLIKLWGVETAKMEHLYQKETDFFVSVTIEDVKEKLIFARAVGGGWFSFNNYMWDGMLDVDGSLKKRMYKNYS